MFAFFFLLDSQEVWEMKFLNQHLTWMIKIRPCKEPVNSSLEAVVRVIFFTGVPVIITLCPWKKIACLLTPKQQSAKHKPFRLVFQTSLWPTAFSVIPTLKPERSACFYYYWNTNHEHSDYLSICVFPSAYYNLQIFQPPLSPQYSVYSEDLDTSTHQCIPNQAEELQQPQCCWFCAI